MANIQNLREAFRLAQAKLDAAQKDYSINPNVITQTVLVDALTTHLGIVNSLRRAHADHTAVIEMLTK